MSWNSVPPSTTLSSCIPPQTPSTGMFRRSAACSSAVSKRVRAGFNVPRPSRAASPYASGGTSKAPPVTTSPEIRSRNASIIAGSLASGSTIGSPPARSTASAYGDFST